MPYIMYDENRRYYCNFVLLNDVYSLSIYEIQRMCNMIRTYYNVYSTGSSFIIIIIISGSVLD